MYKNIVFFVILISCSIHDVQAENNDVSGNTFESTDVENLKDVVVTAENAENESEIAKIISRTILKMTEIIIGAEKEKTIINEEAEIKKSENYGLEATKIFLQKIEPILIGALCLFALVQISSSMK